MAQTVQQPVQVVMVPVAQQPVAGQMVGTTGGGETNQQVQQVVVVQQPATAVGATVPDTGNRYTRWAYAVFATGVCTYNFIYMIFYLGLSFAESEYGALFFFCGFVPSTLTFVWIIMDATVFCGNPGSGAPRKICCCDCVNGWIMLVPMAVASGLRCILWISYFGILADVLADVSDGDEAIDNVFWIILSIASIDVGPMILLTIDFWWYYAKADYDALFGTKYNPLRCIVGQQVLLLICGWSLVAMFEEYADDAVELIWPWILHGVMAIALLVMAAILNFSGAVSGNVLSNGLLRIVMMGLGVGLAVLCLVISGYMLDWAFTWGADVSFFFTLLFLIYWTLYLGLSVPSIWSCFSFKTAEQVGALPAESP